MRELIPNTLGVLSYGKTLATNRQGARSIRTRPHAVRVPSTDRVDRRLPHCLWGVQGIWGVGHFQPKHTNIEERAHDGPAGAPARAGQVRDEAPAWKPLARRSQTEASHSRAYLQPVQSMEQVIGGGRQRDPGPSLAERSERRARRQRHCPVAEQVQRPRLDVPITQIMHVQP